MDMHLVVVRPFGGLARGDLITDPNRIGDILAGEHAAHVVRVCTPEGATPAAQNGKREG
jgi:hypothetical protein